MAKHQFTASPEMDALMATLENGGLPTNPARGTLVPGTVVSMTAQGAWVDLGAKVDGLVDPRELTDVALEVGKRSVFFVTFVSEDEDGSPIGLSAVKAKSWSDMSTARDSGSLVTVRVTRVAKNGSGGVSGLNVVHGESTHGFVPFTLLGNDGKAIAARLSKEHTGRPRKEETIELSVKVTEVDPAKRKLIFDRAAAAQAEQADRQAQRDELFDSLAEGKVYPGKVVKIGRKDGPSGKREEYGVFVDVGSGLHGLVHRSEITNDPTAVVSELVKVGDVVQVKVLKAERVPEGDRRLSLSIKQPKQEAFLADLKARFDAAKAAGEDLIVSGPVRSSAYGCFVKLSDEVDGLLHRSEFSSKLRREKENPTGTVKVKVLLVDPATGRVGLSMRDVAQERQAPKAAAPAETEAPDGEIVVVPQPPAGETVS